MAGYGIIAWLIIGGVAGWLAGLVMQGGGYGVIGDIIIGIIGSVVAGWLFGTLGIAPGAGVIGSIIAAAIGAIVLIFVLRLIRSAV
jgi:uncharacterized membrane protein YeaQ/YmgE (transglycosylase-associated protein family)